MADTEQPGAVTPAEAVDRQIASDPAVRLDESKPTDPDAGDGVAASAPASPPAAVAKPGPAPRKIAKPAPKPAATNAGKPPARKLETAPKAAPRTTIKPTPKPAPKPAPTSTPTGGSAPATAIIAPTAAIIAQIKDIPMDVSNSIKEAFTKTSAAATEYGEFAKGNVEAFVESGKILAAGLQELSNSFVAEGKAAFDTATADVKALSGVKSPADFFKLQTEFVRRNFDTAVAYSTRTGEAMVKLTSDAFAPLSGRVSLAVEKVKTAA